MASPRFPYQPQLEPDVVTAWYEGVCPATKQLCRLPRTKNAEAIARELMAELRENPDFNWEGKMYGVLLAETATGQRVFLKAFSGLLKGEKVLPGWVPPMDGGDRLILEEQEILAQLRQIRREIQRLETLPERKTYQTLQQQWQTKIAQFNQERRQKKQVRRQKREVYQTHLTGAELAQAIAALEEESRQESNHKRDLKQARDQEINPLTVIIDQADQDLQSLRQRRKTLSRTLQKRMHQVYHLKNFQGESKAIADLFPTGLPTGTGDCCAPKLLNYAAKQNLKPLAMAEFWWGKNSPDKQVGEFYLACEERCQPILGFLLSGLGGKSFQDILTTPEIPLEIIYEDHSLIAIHKPAGLPSIPGRSSQTYDSAFSRLRRDYQDIFLVHRLDQDTSGILLFAKNAETQQNLQTQFRRRKIHKEYEALLEEKIQRPEGIITLPLWADPGDRPRQKVDAQRGKPSETYFIKLDSHRLKLKPITGRTHQLRVHCAHPDGLNNPILGDRLYGNRAAPRLHLQATALTFMHPKTKNPHTIQSAPEF
ncbi:RluA family pseudouridine synthase [Picosynechococcus sp. PCC 7117]|uniref:RluA family pseudouridine synthase n=1 Tax=Picosynechococcus sp. PCC 7117 TaxID=195498 RepID=UPI000810663C|nr:RluA family pseudouridine synthase [Picosynechococcus sp. PCC 7117]ANV88555.1 RNA pseudouridine synthase [Picosynechococcus sp. PCC 7117]